MGPPRSCRRQRHLFLFPRAKTSAAAMLRHGRSVKRRIVFDPNHAPRRNLSCLIGRPVAGSDKRPHSPPLTVLDGRHRALTWNQSSSGFPSKVRKLFPTLVRPDVFDGAQ